MNIEDIQLHFMQMEQAFGNPPKKTRVIVKAINVLTGEYTIGGDSLILLENIKQALEAMNL